MTNFNERALAAEAARLCPWHYPLLLGSVAVPLGKQKRVKQLRGHAAVRERILVDSLLRHYDFSGKRILDLGCAGGYWGGFYAKHGAKFYLGVDGRQHIIDQGNLYWKTNNFLPIEQYKFLLADVMSARTWRTIKEYEPFDFCLLAGLLYHLPKPYTVLKRAIKIASEAIVVDTQTNSKKDKPSIKRGINFGRLPQHTKAVSPHRDTLLAILNKSVKFCIDLAAGVDVSDHRWPPGQTYHGGKRIAMLLLKQ